MKKIIFIVMGLIFFFYLPQYIFATTVEVPVDMSIIDGCGGTTCSIANGESGLSQIFESIVRYITLIASLIGVLYIVVNGIAYSMSGVDESLKSKSKSRIIKMLLGLILLLLSAMILHIIAPWVY